MAIQTEAMLYTPYYLVLYSVLFGLPNNQYAFYRKVQVMFINLAKWILL